MTDSILKPAEFRPATNYDTNPYYDTNFDHSVVDPLKQIDGRLDALETTIDTEDTGLVDRVSALENAPEPSALVIGIVPGATESDPMTLDKNWEEIEETVLSGRTLLMSGTDGDDVLYYQPQYQLGYLPTSHSASPYQIVLTDISNSTKVFGAQTRTGVLTEVTSQ